jgi:hypothetical protein
MKRKIKKAQKEDKGGATAISSTKEDTAWANRPVFSGFLGGNVRNIYIYIVTCISTVLMVYRYSSPRKDFEG